jgi:hypothetical protein
MGIGGQCHVSAALLPGPGTHCTGGRLGPRAGLDACGKFRLHWDFNPWTIQPTASHYTDCAILAPLLMVQN